MSDFRLSIGQCDLYFIVQLFCIIFLTILHEFTLYLGVWLERAGIMSDLKYIVDHSILNFMIRRF